MTEKLLGSILVKHHLVTQGQLIQALQKQRQQAKATGWQLLGEILMESGLISAQELADALDKQAQLYAVESFGISAHPATYCRVKRSIDLIGAIIGLVVMVILLPVIAIAIRLDSAGPIFVAQRYIGLRGDPFKVWRFRTTLCMTGYDRWQGTQNGHVKLSVNRNEASVTKVGKILRRFSLDELPGFWNVLRGEMSLVGIHPSPLDDVKGDSGRDWQHLVVKPGMIGTWQIHRNKHSMQVNDIARLDSLYIRRWSNNFDLKILMHTACHRFVNPASKPSQYWQPVCKRRQVNILNVPIDNLTMQELLAQLDCGFVVTPNVDHLMKLQKDVEFYKIYSLADYKVCDSQILLYASRLLGTPLKERISGSDLLPAFCKFHRANQSVNIFLLGGAKGVADRARTRINQKVGREIVIAAHSPSFGFERNEQECLEIVDRINQSRATVLAVGVGAPKQEKWIEKYKDQMPYVKIFMAVGATIDFEAGVLKRAPAWVSQLGMEWLFRIAYDPKRLWKRYLVDDVPFLWLLLKQKFGVYVSPFPPSPGARSQLAGTQPVSRNAPSASSPSEEL